MCQSLLFNKVLLGEISKNTFFTENLWKTASDPSNREDTNKIDKLQWIPIIGPKLKEAFKKNKLQPCLHQAHV